MKPSMIKMLAAIAADAIKRKPKPKHRPGKVKK